MATELIAGRVSIAGRYVRAADIARDFADPRALDGYVMVRSVRDGLRRLLAGLGPGSTQRAFRVTGPYGSGKSSFGVLVAQLFEEGAGGGPATNLVRGALGAVDVPRYHPLVLVGRRASLAKDLTALLGDLARGVASGDEGLAAVIDKLETSGRSDTKQVLDCLVACSESLRANSECGLLLLIDEMGRYLEFAASHPARDDPSIFQQLAERAGGARQNGLAVVGFLHHRFGDYVSTLGDWLEGEWTRSSERYEEITFHESHEQSLYLLSQALVPGRAHDEGVKTAVRSLYGEAGRRGLFMLSRDDLLPMADRLYPLAPGALACLLAASSRFGQTERSVFSFLQSSEPSGFQDFAHRTAYGGDNWYRIDDFFDYLASQGSFRFRSNDRERRWQIARDAMARFADMPRDTRRVLKAVSLIAVLEPVPGLCTDAETLAWLLGCTEGDVNGALALLAERGVLHRRQSRGDWSLWSHSSVDLDDWLTRARTAIARMRRLDDELYRHATLRPIVAQRHYHRTGTLRTFSVVVGVENAHAGETDGVVLICPVYPDQDYDEARAEAARVSSRMGPLSIVRLERITSRQLVVGRDLACWRWVRAECRELRIDDFARAEVTRRIEHLENEMRRSLLPFAHMTADTNPADWFHDGKEVVVPSRADLSRFLSEICDGAFSQAPILRCELINRERLTSAAAAARMRLLGLMLTEEGRDSLGLERAPPERTIYLSVFHASGIHRVVDGRLRFAGPPPDDPMGWAPTWACIDRIAKSSESVSLDRLVGGLQESPIGLRAGPALLIIAAYMLHHRDNVALMERGSFQPEITHAHFMRLAKTPGNFALRRVSADEDEMVLGSLVRGVSVLAEARPPSGVKGVVVALYGWWGQLSDFARNTRTIDATAERVRAVFRKATDPVELLFDQLPKACDSFNDEGIDIARYTSSLDRALTQMDNALPELRRQVQANILTGFGAPSLGRLRERMKLDYEDCLPGLGNYELRAVVERVLKEPVDEDTWIDGVAGLVVGKRLDSWDDTMLDHFGFEIRSVAQKLARRLALIRESGGRAAMLTAIHLTTADGEERSLFLHDGAIGDRRIRDKMRGMLAEAERPDAVLVGLLDEVMDAKIREGRK